MAIELVLLGAVVPIASGAFVVRHDRRHPVGWLLSLQGVAFAAVLRASGPHADGAGLVADQLLAGAWVLLFAPVAVSVYLVPDGRPPTAFWRRWMTAGIAGAALLVLGAPGDRTGFVELHGGTEPPVTWLPEAPSAVLGVTGLVGVVALLFGAVGCAGMRLRRSSGVERQRLLWLVLGAVPIPVAVAVGWMDHFAADGDLSALFDVALVLASASLPVSLAVAIVRYQLFDIRVVLGHVLTSLGLAAAVAALYAAMWALSSAITGTETSAGLATVALVALVAHPLAVNLHRRVDRWVHGFGSTPYLAVRRVSMRSAAARTDDLVDAVLRSAAEAVGAVRVWIEPGPPQGDASSVPIVVAGQQLGVLAVELPPDRVGMVDGELLEDIARYVGLVVYSDGLNAELRAANARLLESRREERRRLHRDLHDGLGPTLAAIVLKLDVARRRTDATDRTALLDEVRLDARSAADEVRRIVEDLRPTALEGASLIEALHARARSLSTDETAFTVDGPASMPDVPRPVEDAAYRIASEAMANAAKHAGARRCTVEVAISEVADGRVVALSILDDGCGPSPLNTPGAGSRTMAERAAELGGACLIGPGPTGGTLVRVELPLRPGVTASEAMVQP